MEYKKFPNTDIVASRLGMGCMRLPTRVDGDKTAVDREASVALIRSAIDRGVNYIDTAYGYMNSESEVVTGNALEGGYRERVTLATKLPPWHVKAYGDMERILDEQLKKLGVDKIDVYLVHSLREQSYADLREMGLHKFLDAMIGKGKIRYPAFSFHDGAAAFEKIITDYPWMMAQVQMNVLDEFNQATYEMIAKHGSRTGIVAMEPLRGGALAGPVPPEVEAVYDSAPVRRSPVEWAFRWLYDKPEFVTILSGMSSMGQLDENLAIFEASSSGAMDEGERELMARVKAAYEGRVKAGCTGCEYCMPCPGGVNIPAIFGAWDEASMFARPERFKRRYEHIAKEGGDGGKCSGCGECEEKCPQGLKIRELLIKARGEAAQ